jgi:Cu(I)/Ag(I) efflux system periplasmic protein CusF
MTKLVFTTFAGALSLSSAVVLAQKQMDDMSRMPAASASTATAHHIIGVVKKVDPKLGLVTIAHEPVKSLNWPSMTMGFLVKDKALLDKLAVGQRVDFDFEQGSKGYVVIAVK